MAHPEGIVLLAKASPRNVVMLAQASTRPSPKTRTADFSGKLGAGLRQHDGK